MGESFYTRTTETPPSAFDLSLRPPAFSEFRGQEKIKERLMLMVEAARQRDDVLDHILLSGSRPGEDDACQYYRKCRRMPDSHDFRPPD